MTAAPRTPAETPTAPQTVECPECEGAGRLRLVWYAAEAEGYREDVLDCPACGCRGRMTLREWEEVERHDLARRARRPHPAGFTAEDVPF